MYLMHRTYLCHVCVRSTEYGVLVHGKRAVPELALKYGVLDTAYGTGTRERSFVPAPYLLSFNHSIQFLSRLPHRRKSIEWGDAKC